MFPAESLRGVPSGARIRDKNWYSVLLASTARLFPLRSSKRMVLLTMMGVRLTPIVDHNTITVCKEEIIFFQCVVKVEFPKIFTKPDL